MNRKSIFGASLLVAALAITTATAGSSTDTLSVTATKPSTTTSVAFRNTADNADVTSLSFGTLTKDVAADSTAFILKVSTYNVATGGSTLDLAFSWPGQTGYTIQYKVGAGSATSFGTSLTQSVTAGELVDYFYTAAGIQNVAASAASVKFTVTAGGTAVADLSGTITVTATLP